MNQENLRLKVAGMDCGGCAMTIENSMRQLAGVDDVSVNFTTETMELTGNVSRAAVESRLNALGYSIAVPDDAPLPATTERDGLVAFAQFLWAQPPLRRALIVAIVVLAGIVILPLANLTALGTVATLPVLFGVSVLVAGMPVLVKGLRALLFARRVTIDLLMAIACLGALGIGENGEAVTIMLLFMLGEALEAYSAERARDSLRSLLALQPQEACVLGVHSSGHGNSDHDHAHHDHVHQTVKAVADVRVNDRILVRPGERVPLDGRILEGISSVNQAPVTGENMPVVKEPGDEVMAGTVNGEAALEICVTRPSAEGTIARIARLVERAQSERSPAERFIDRFARYYTPAVVGLAVLVVAIPVLAFGAPFLDTPDGAQGWLYRGLTLLIIACPCALVISIPVTVVSGLTRLAQLGVLVKSGALLDRLADIRVVAFDKTGTLTHGKPVVTHMQSSDCAHPAQDFAACEPCEDIIDKAASVERASEHPVAHAIVEAATARGRHVAMAAAVEAHAGLGVSGTADCGHIVAVGSRRLFADNQPGLSAVESAAREAEASGDTVMYVSHDDTLLGYIGVQDAVRDASRTALRALDAMQPQVRSLMLTGDNTRAAQRIADEIGIDDVRAELLPEDKLNVIDQLASNGEAVAMVGDGINDAPALARADIGMAMGGGGTAQAMETADVVLMQDDLSQVPLAIRMARTSRVLIKQNIALSLGLKFAFLALAIPGVATLWMAVVADVGATLLVTLNGMRLMRVS